MLTSFRTRVAFASAATALLALGAAIPASAAAAPRTFTFTIAANNSVTNFVTCPPGTPSNVMLCGYGLNEHATSASNTGGDAGLSGSNVTISFVSTLDTPTSTAACAFQIDDASAVTISTSKGKLLLVTHNGAYCASAQPPTDTEPFTIVGGTGEYAGATGSGTIVAHPTAPQTATQGFSADTYSGTITLAQR